MLKRLLLVISSSICLSQMDAQIITDRPDQTESSSTIGKSQLQLESGFLVEFVEDSGQSNRTILAPTNLFRYGITKNIELRLLNQYESFNGNDISRRGISDIQVGTKIQLLRDDDKNTEIAFLSHLIIPSGSVELKSDNYGTINKLSISHTINDNLGIGYNLGYDYFGTGSGSLTYSLALGVSVNDKVGVYIEPYGILDDFEDFTLNFDTGFTYLTNENLQFDFSFGTGINQRMNYLSIGFSWLLTMEIHTRPIKTYICCVTSEYLLVQPAIIQTLTYEG